jgi:hypothetical protein
MYLRSDAEMTCRLLPPLACLGIAIELSLSRYANIHEDDVVCYGGTRHVVARHLGCRLACRSACVSC